MSEFESTANSARLDRLEDLRLAEDVLLRFAEGQDRSDKDLFASSFAEGAVMDFAQPADVFGVELDLFKGKGTIVETVFQNIAALQTSHTVTNQRISIHGDRATGTALVEAQHVAKDNPEQFLLLKNFYDIDLVRDGMGWAMEKVVIRNIWYIGQKSVLFG